MSTQFQVTIRCMNPECSHRYKRVMEAADAESLDYIPDPPCPKCAVKRKAKKFDFKSGKAPAAGGSLIVRAVDTTLNMVSEDYGMTDLRTNVREGESMAPKLPPKQQAMADNFFARPAGGQRRRGPTGGIFDLSPKAVMQAAVNGRFNTPDTPNPVAIQHRKRDAAPIHIVAGDGIGRPGK